MIYLKKFQNNVQHYLYYFLFILTCLGYQSIKSAAMPLQLEDFSKKQKLEIGSLALGPVVGLGEDIVSEQSENGPEQKVSLSHNAEQAFGGDPMMSSMFPVTIQQLIKAYHVHPMDYFGVVSRVTQMVGSHARLIVRIAVTPDANTVVTGSSDNSAKIWRDGKCVATLPHAGIVCGADISKDAQTIVTGSLDRNIKVWDCDGKLEHTINVGRLVNSVVVASNGVIAASCADGKIRIYKQNNLVNEFSPRVMTDALILALASDDSLLVTTTGNDIVWRHNDMNSTLLQGHAARSQGLAVAFDGTIVTGSNDKTAKIWREGKCVATLPHIDRVICVAIAPYRMHFDKTLQEDVLAQSISSADNIIISGCVDGFARIWKDNECKVVFPIGYGSAVALAADGTVVTGNGHGQVFVFKPDQNLIKKLYKLTFAELEQLKQLMKSIEVLVPEADGGRRVTAEQWRENGISVRWSELVGNGYAFYRCKNSLTCFHKSKQAMSVLLKLPQAELNQFHDLTTLINRQRSEEVAKSGKKSFDELPVLLLTPEHSAFLVKMPLEICNAFCVIFNCRLFPCDEVIDCILKGEPEAEKIKKLIKAIATIVPQGNGATRVTFEQWKEYDLFSQKQRWYVDMVFRITNIMVIFRVSPQTRVELDKLPVADQKKLYDVLEPVAAQRKQELLKSGKKSCAELAPMILTHEQSAYLSTLSHHLCRCVCVFYNLIPRGVEIASDMQVEEHKESSSSSSSSSSGPVAGHKRKYE